MKYISGTGSGKEQEGERTEQEQPRVHSLKTIIWINETPFMSILQGTPKLIEIYPGPKDSLASDSRLISSKTNFSVSLLFKKLKYS